MFSLYLCFVKKKKLYLKMHKKNKTKKPTKKIRKKSVLSVLS